MPGRRVSRCPSIKRPRNMGRGTTSIATSSGQMAWVSSGGISMICNLRTLSPGWTSELLRKE